MNVRKVSGLASLLLAGLMGAALPGCAPEVMPARQHAPTTADSVVLYQKQPQKYEMLGLIEVPVTDQVKWEEKGDATPAFNALKAKAAAMGANGVLLDAPKGSWDVMVTAGYKDQWYQVPVKANPKAAVAQAIYVPEKK